MPRLTRLFVRAALVYFVAALVAGFLLAARVPLRLPPVVGALSPVYFHLLMVGWVTQLIFGVMYWMVPRFSAEKPHGSEGLAWATFALLNAGLLLRTVVEPMKALYPTDPAGRLLAISAVLQWLAGIGMVVSVWPRVKGR